MTAVLHLQGQTFHGRRGAVENRFRYGVDYVLIDPEASAAPSLFSRNKGNLLSLWDCDHGGAKGAGRGVHWLREVLAAHDLPAPAQVRLLAQPRVMGHVFNPVSFWLCRDAAGGLTTVIAEVSNTFGDRHSYLVHRADHGPIQPSDQLAARKIFHVSPFQPVEGGYLFRFDLTGEKIAIVIDYSAGANGLVATLTGKLTPLTNAGILRTCLRRPFGSRRVLTLIHWQALRLWWKGARFHSRPLPPADEVS
jgi:uncharacterized protein